jgi:hypothetical protein
MPLMPKGLMTQSTAQNRDALLRCHPPGKEAVAYNWYELTRAYIEPGVGGGQTSLPPLETLKRFDESPRNQPQIELGRFQDGVA